MMPPTSLALRADYPRVADFVAESELGLLRRAEGVRDLFGRLGLLGRDSYPLQELSAAFAAFFSERPPEPALADKALFLRLPSAFIDFQKARSLRWDRERFTAPFEPNRQAIDAHFERELETANGRLRVFEFGVGQGLFIKRLAGLARRRRPGTAVELAGFDPFVSKPDPDVHYLADPGAFSGGADWLLCRWVLHHVRPQERWTALGAILSKLRGPCSVHVIEEGTFLPFERQSLAERVYTLLLVMTDLAFNAVVRSDWGLSEDYFIDHLHEGDLAAVEALLPRPFSREVRRFQAFNFHQTLLSYRLER